MKTLQDLIGNYEGNTENGCETYSSPRQANLSDLLEVLKVLQAENQRLKEEIDKTYKTWDSESLWRISQLEKLEERIKTLEAIWTQENSDRCHVNDELFERMKISEDEWKERLKKIEKMIENLAKYN